MRFREPWRGEKAPDYDLSEVLSGEAGRDPYAPSPGALEAADDRARRAIEATANLIQLLRVKGVLTDGDVLGLCDGHWEILAEAPRK